MSTRFDWTCPYCGTNQIAWDDLDSTITRKIVYCDTDQGGCDKLVALFLSVTVNVRVYELLEVKE